MKPLCVLAWDHPRATRPLRACAEAWEARTGAPFEVAVRSLESFGDDVPEGVDADLVLIDHPHVGAAAAAGAIVPLDGLVPIPTGTIGASQRSYDHAGRTWALAVDAACQALALRDGAPPTTWAEVADFPGRVALPLHPAHAISALLSLLAAFGYEAGGARLAPAEALERSVTILARIAALGPREAFEWEPPDALTMLEAGGIDCIPLVYTYVGYDVAWHDAPAIDAGGVPGSILGGVGVAVLASSSEPSRAAALAAWLADAATQSDLIAPNGGQPADRGAWPFPTILRTIEHSRLRPRDRWWPAFQRAGGDVLRDGLATGDPVGEIVDRLQLSYRTHRRAER